MKDLLANCKIIELVEAVDPALNIDEDIDIEGFGAAMVLVSCDNAVTETTITLGEDADGNDIEEVITGSGVLMIRDFPGLVRANSTEFNIVNDDNDALCIFVLLLEPRYAPVDETDHEWV